MHQIILIAVIIDSCQHFFLTLSLFTLFLSRMIFQRIQNITKQFFKELKLHSKQRRDLS